MNHQRHASIVELLSMPPQLPLTGESLEECEQANVGLPSIGAAACGQDSSFGDTPWQQIQLSALVEPNKLITIPGSLSVEASFNKLVKHHLTSLPVQTHPDEIHCLTFDYNDLNAYLLLVLDKITVKNEQVARDGQSGRHVSVGDIVRLVPKDPFIRLPDTDNLATAMAILGSGVHRIAITNPQMTAIRGILSQRRLVKYLWDNARSFKDLDPLLNASLQDLQIGSLYPSTPDVPASRIISIEGDEPLINALEEMHVQRISSIAVVDDHNCLIGNISVTDVKYVTRTSQYPLLSNTCRHFISVILNTRGLENGKDSFPIFHVNPATSLRRTIAKLVATKSHRLWIVEQQEASALQMNDPHTSPMLSSVDASSGPTLNLLADQDRSTGKLIGVVSLTDILSNLARRQTDNKLVDPQQARRLRGGH